MPFLKKNASHGEKAPVAGPSTGESSAAASQKVTFIAVFLGVVASIGGFMFGYVRYAFTNSTPAASPDNKRGHVLTQMTTVVRFPVSSKCTTSVAGSVNYRL